MKTKTTKRVATEDRFACGNWDPVVRIKKNGTSKCVHRKVITRGEHLLADEWNILGEIKKLLRQGYDVRFGDGYENCVRFYPCMNTECTEMMVVACTMGGFRHDTLRDKTVTVVHKGEEIDGAAYAAKKNKVAQQNRKNTIMVTPDTMVTCPECGANFRVGNKISA